MRLERLPAGRRTNLALLLLLVGAVATGGTAFAIGTELGRWVVVAHGAAGLAIVLLAPWKGAISARGLRRRREGSWASVVLAGLVTVTLATGFGHSTGIARTFGPVTAMQLHVAAALASLPFAVWHVAARRVRPRRTDLSRRTLIRAGALAGGAVGGYAAMEGLIRVAGLAGAERRFTGSYEVAPGEMPVTQWLDDEIPAIATASWRLSVLSADGERTWSLDDLATFADRVRVTLDCTGGWYATAVWEGARLSRLLGDASGASSVIVTSATGYARRLPVSDADRLLLATRLEGRALSPGHGSPARLVAPGRRGFWWVKWVVRIELDGAPWWWQSPFPLT